VSAPERTEAVAASDRTDPVAQLRADIEHTRLRLGDTVEALAGKTDVKARAKGKVAEIRGNVSRKGSALKGSARNSGPDGANAAAVQVRAKVRANPVPAAAVAALVGGFLLGRITKRR
jgi:ElaB/YqjD/DUF883 family membrane-anchored ribosome-binding protein